MRISPREFELSPCYCIKNAPFSRQMRSSSPNKSGEMSSNFEQIQTPFTSFFSPPFSNLNLEKKLGSFAHRFLVMFVFVSGSGADEISFYRKRQILEKIGPEMMKLAAKTFPRRVEFCGLDSDLVCI